MRSSIFYLTITFFLGVIFSGCNSHVYNRRRYNPDAMGVEYHPTKRSRTSLTYPPSDFSESLIDFRKKIGRWPDNWMELGLQSKNASNVIESMLKTNFDKLDIKYTSNDSLSIYYEYLTVPKSYKSNNFVLNRMYKGYYIFTYHENNIFVDNKEIKRHQKRH